jgi:hypothetical protein
MPVICQRILLDTAHQPRLTLDDSNPTRTPVLKSAFRSFINPSPSELDAAWRSDTTVFIFDTNVLLNLYGFEEQTRNDFFTLATQLQERIWLPFHVGLEYNRHRLSVIGREKKTFRTLEEVADTSYTRAKDELEKLNLKEKFPEINGFSDELLSEIKKATLSFKAKIQPWDDRQPDVRSEDSILNRIHDLTEGRIGSPPGDQNWLDSIYAEGKVRYSNGIPPGFKDAKKDKPDGTPNTFTHDHLIYDGKFGDLIIWKQILQHVRKTETANVIFITDDVKRDWWSRFDSGGWKTIGPHEELRKEIYNISTVSLFHMYTTSDFLRNGGEALKVDVQERSISDATTKRQIKRAIKPHVFDYAEMYRQYTQTLKDLENPSVQLAKYYETFKSPLESSKWDYGALRGIAEQMNEINRQSAIASLANIPDSVQQYLSTVGTPIAVSEYIKDLVRAESALRHIQPQLGGQMGSPTESDSTNSDGDDEDEDEDDALEPV